MQCPRCKSRTLVLQKTKRVCKLPECYFEDQHPISYENDVRHFQDQKGAQNRYSPQYGATLDLEGATMEKQANFEKQYRKGQKYIKDICLLLKLNQRIQSTAEARFITILKLKIKGKLQKEGQQQSGDKKKKQLSFSIKQISTYSVYSACFQNQNFFEDHNLARWLKVDKRKWQKLLLDMNSELKKKITFIPIEQSWHLILKVCRKRKIEKPEQNAMVEMCKRIYRNGIQDGCPRKTVAACVFWKICQYSQRYKNEISLAQICKSKDEIKELLIGKQQRYFQCTPQTIRKFFNEKMEKEFFDEYLPDWEGRKKIERYKQPQMSNYYSKK